MSLPFVIVIVSIRVWEPELITLSQAQMHHNLGSTSLVPANLLRLHGDICEMTNISIYFFQEDTLANSAELRSAFFLSLPTGTVTLT